MAILYHYYPYFANHYSGLTVVRAVIGNPASNVVAVVGVGTVSRSGARNLTR